MHLLKRARKSAVASYLAITAGVAVCIAALNFFLLPQQIAPGGFSGIAAIFYYLFSLPVGAVTLALNVPLFILAYRHVGRSFALRTLYALILYSVLADIIPVYTLSDDAFLSAIYGGVLMGLGLGIVFFFGGSTGGSDLLAKLINHYVSFLSLGTVLFLVDFAVIVAAGAIFDMQAALLALVSLYLTAKLVELFTEGIARARTFLIITREGSRVVQAVFEKMQRGMTELDGRGAYSGEQKSILLCTVESGSEAIELKQIVEEADNGAFVIVWEAKEVRGLGFSS